MQLLPEGVLAYLLGGEYNEQKKCIRLIFYEPKENKLYDWYGENSKHYPYCYTNLSPIDLEKIKLIKQHPNLKKLELISKYDALNDKTIWLTKIIMDNPKAIGRGRKNISLREIIPSVCPQCFSKLKLEEGKKKEKDKHICSKCGIVNPPKIWETKIPYDCSYYYDNGLEVGMLYSLCDGKLFQKVDPQVQTTVANVAEKLMLDAHKDKVNSYRWITLCEFPVPDFLRVAFDIEVLGESKAQVPSTIMVNYPIVSASFVGSDGSDKVLILLRDGVEIGEADAKTSIEFFDKEADLIQAIFDEIAKYPFVITFNGDNFDLPYVRNRALKLGLSDIPITISKRKATIKNAIHIDLYRFFFNKSIKTYAFGNKYEHVSLDNISNALIGEGKLVPDGDKDMSEWSYSELAKYNSQDSKITLKLTTYDDGLVMKLMLVLARIATMSLEELTRFPISQWIRGMMFYQHRKRNMIIPNREDLIEIKGQSSTKAMVKGKKFKGATVIIPIAGIHFNAKVMDFASLYPTVFKIRNLGYATVRCPHEECHDNLIPETNHWVCKKNRAIESETIGLLKDLRVSHYKKLKKENSWYKVIEQAIKVILNATYGVFGDEKFDLYCPPVAEATTAYGRSAIGLTIGKAKSLNIRVLYGDTDSVFLHNPSDEQIKQLSAWSIDALGLDLEVDKTYRYVCLSSRKKNYLGVFPNGKVDVKGMTGKKKHTPQIIRDTFEITKKYFGEAQTKEAVYALKAPLIKVVRNVYLKIKSRKFSLEEMAFHFTLGKAPNQYDKTLPQHVKAARMLEKIGIYMKKGDVISFIKVRNSKWVNPDSKALEDISARPIQMTIKAEVDINKYHEMLRTTFEQILDSLDLDFNEIIGVSKLEQWF